MGFWSKLRKTFQPDRHNAEIDEEIRFHLAMKQQAGSDPRETAIRFGNAVKIREETRGAGILGWLDSLTKDVRYGLRQFRRSSILTFAIVLSLAIGIGANSGIFNIVDAAMLKALPVSDPKSLVLVEWSTTQGWPEALCNDYSGDTTGNPAGPMQGSSVAPRIYRQLARKQKVFASLIGFSDPNPVAVVAGKRPAEQTSLQYVSSNFFQGLGAPPRLGRSFLSEDDQVGREPVVVVSYRFWRNQLDGSDDVLNQSLHINNTPARIVGVAPPHFYGLQIGDWVDLYAPLAARVAFTPGSDSGPRRGERDDNWWVRQIARVKPGIDLGRARGQLSALFQHIAVPEGIHLDAAKIPSLIASPGRRGFDPIGGSESKALWILLLLGGLALLIVCANVANLLLSRAVARQREAAVCLALGAARARMVRQHLVESILLAGAGGALGMLLGYVLTQSIHSVIQTSMKIGGFDLHVNIRMLAYTGCISLFTALLFGLAPAFRMANANVNEALKAHSRSVLTGRLRLPRALVSFQIALCLTILVTAGLLGQSLLNLEQTDIGFNRNNLVYASVNPWRTGYKPEQVGTYVNRLRAALKAIPGVQRVALLEDRPLSGSTSSTVVNIPGRSYRSDGADAALLNGVSDKLFETLGIPLIVGRTFTSRDMQPASKAVVVDDLFARKYFPNEDPLGRQFGIGPKPTEYYQIVGVVKNSRYYNLRGENQPTMYWPLIVGKRVGSNINFAIRAGIDSRQLGSAIRRAAAAVDPDVPVIEIQTQTSLIDKILLMDRLLGILSSTFGVIALVLSAIGLAGLLAYAVARRRNEIGIRMALGASSRDIVRLVLQDSLWLVGIGILVGTPGAFALGRVLKGTLFGLQPADPVTLGLSLAVLAIVAAFAAWLPARRAAQVDPMVALRDE